MSPFQLIIRFQDDSIYWQEQFNSKKEMKNWLKSEMSRPYWKKDFKVEEIDNTAAVAEKDRQAQVEIKALEDNFKKMRSDLSAFRSKQKVTVAELNEAVNLMLSLMGIEAKKDE